MITGSTGKHPCHHVGRSRRHWATLTSKRVLKAKKAHISVVVRCPDRQKLPLIDPKSRMALRQGFGAFGLVFPRTTHGRKVRAFPSASLAFGRLLPAKVGPCHFQRSLIPFFPQNSFKFETSESTVKGARIRRGSNTNPNTYPSCPVPIIVRFMFR